MKKSAFSFLAGLLVGITLFGGTAAYAAGIMAEVSNQKIYVDGELVPMEAYAIGGHNYVKLRDIGAAVGFNVSWDNENRCVVINSSESYEDEGAIQKQSPSVADQDYTISSSAWSREDFSARANPAVFTGVYDRDLYNAIRQTIVDKGSQDTPGYLYAYTMVDDASYGEVKSMVARLDGVVRYEHHVPANITNYYEYLDYFAVSCQTPETYQSALEYIQPVLEKVNSMASDRDKVIYLNEYLCSLLVYDRNAVAGIGEIFSDHSGDLKAACGTYVRAFNFLCEAAGIPCITTGYNNHGWNLVYVDGQWLHVDVAQNDCQLIHDAILLSPTAFNRGDRAPEATAFLKELLVPGSTK